MEEVIIWASPDGCNAAKGTQSDPFTLRAAVEAIRGKGFLNTRIMLKSGMYLIDEPLTLGAQDHNIRFQAEESGKAVLCGARPVRGWEKGEINGVAVWYRDMEPEYGDFRSLFDEKASLPRTRYPKEGFLHVQKVDERDAIIRNDPNVYLQKGMYAFPEDLRDFHNMQDVLVKVLHYWKDETANLKAMNLEDGKLDFSRRMTMTIKPGDRYFLENVLEELRDPGEWYFDRVTRRLYYVPRPQDEIETTVLYAGATDQLIVIDGASGLTFDGLRFTMSDWRIPVGKIFPEGADHHQAAFDVAAAIDVCNASEIHFTGCRFDNILSTCLKFGVNVQRFSITHNLFYYIGANVIFLVGENLPVDDPRVTREFIIEDNHIYKYGRRFYNATAIGVLLAREGKVINNTIHDGFTIAITIGWVWGYGHSVTGNILVKRNHIWKVGQELLADMAAVYTLGVKEGVVITENTVHDVQANLKYGYGGWGIYMDEGSCDVTVTKNLIYRCNSTNFYQHYGRDNLIINNIMAFGDEASASAFRVQPHVGYHLIRNIMVTRDRPFISLKDLERLGQILDANNICWDYEKKDRGIDREQMSRDWALYNNAVFVDPQFEDPDHDDFRLKPTSPALALGFVPWDLTKAGAITDFSFADYEA